MLFGEDEAESVNTIVVVCAVIGAVLAVVAGLLAAGRFLGWITPGKAEKARDESLTMKKEELEITREGHRLGLEDEAEKKKAFFIAWIEYERRQHLAMFKNTGPGSATDVKFDMDTGDWYGLTEKERKGECPAKGGKFAIAMKEPGNKFGMKNDKPPFKCKMTWTNEDGSEGEATIPVHLKK